MPIALLSMIIALAASLLFTALLFLIVYDPEETHGMSFKQALGYCFRQIASPWPWR